MPVMNWNTLHEYQPLVERTLKNSIRLNRLSHSYIFEGMKGTKRYESALLFAKTLLCEHLDEELNPCEKCHQCERINKDGHPNVFIVRRDGEKIKKKQMKDLINEFSRSSVEKGPRIYIIDEAERLNPESSNALLKTMEEPGQDIYQVLVTDQMNSLLKTIVSRAQVIHFRPIDQKLIKKDLLDKDTDSLIADAITEYTYNYDEAETLSKSEVIKEIIFFTRDMYKSLEKKSGSIILSFKDKKDKFLSNYDLADFTISMFILFQKDILNYKLRHLENIVFDEEKPMFKELSSRMSGTWIEDTLTQMLELKQRLKFNINTSLAFDKLLLSLERGFYYGVSSRTDSI